MLGEQEIAQFLALLRIAHHYRNNVRLTGHYRQEAWRIEDGLCPRCAFLMAVALPLRGLEVPDRRGERRRRPPACCDFFKLAGLQQS